MRNSGAKEAKQQPLGGDPPEIQMKFLLLGDSAVGKSSLLMRFCDNAFESSFVLTIGVDFKKKVIDCDDRRLKLQIWDTAGQERFRTITPAYFRSAMGIVMVYDVSNVQSFKNVMYWMKNVSDFGDSNVATILVGNKIDLVNSRRVATQQGAALASEFGAKFAEASAKTGHRVEDIFVTLAREVIQRRTRQLRSSSSHDLVERGGESVQLEDACESGEGEKTRGRCCG